MLLAPENAGRSAILRVQVTWSVPKRLNLAQAKDGRCRRYSQPRSLYCAGTCARCICAATCVHSRVPATRARQRVEVLHTCSGG